MMYTTLPSAIIALITFFILGFTHPPAGTEVVSIETSNMLVAIQEMFDFNLLMLLPPLVVLVGSIKKLATLPTLLASAILACVLAFIFQGFGIDDIMTTLKSGFDTSMVPWVTAVPEKLNVLFNRGGLFELNEVIVFGAHLYWHDRCNQCDAKNRRKSLRFCEN